MAAALTFFICYHKDGDTFLDYIVTNHESCIRLRNQVLVMEWHHSWPPTKPIKTNSQHMKIDSDCVFGPKGILLILTSCQEDRQLRGLLSNTLPIIPYKTNGAACCLVALSSFTIMLIHTQLQQSKQCFNIWLGSF